MWCVVLGSFVVGVLPRMVGKLVYPDSRYYIAMTLRFSGQAPEAAREMTEAVTSVYGITVPEVDSLFGWGLVQPRVVLPLLAALPTKLLGPYKGLALTVFVINLALTVLLTLVLKKHFGRASAITVMLLVNTSLHLQAFKAGILTESLSALWSLLTLLAAWRWLKTRNHWALFAVGATVVASAFTRQATLVVAGALVSAWVVGSLLDRRNNAWMAPAIVALVASVGSQVFQTLVFPFSQSNQFMRMTETETIGQALAATPRLLAGIVRDDLNTFLSGDVSLLVFILLALASMIIFFRKTESHLTLGAFAGFLVYNVTNGNATSFRYGVPGLVFFALSVGLLVYEITKSNRPEAESSTLE